MQFGRRLWNKLRCNGETYAETGYQAPGRVSRAQPGASGSSSTTRAGRSATASTPSDTRAEQFLAQIEPVLLGLSKEWNGRATIDYWPGYEWARGSYSYWKVGQYTAFAGIGAAGGNAHFCGEHTSIDFQGYLNGAVETESAPLPRSSPS